MGYAVEHNRALNIVELVVSGRYTATECRESTSKVIALVKDHGDADVLCDISSVVELALSASDLFNLPDRQYVAEGLSHSVRVALVPSRRPEQQQAVQFWETACLNRGWQVRVFASRADAIGWLTRNDSSSNSDAGDGR